MKTCCLLFLLIFTTVSFVRPALPKNFLDPHRPVQSYDKMEVELTKAATTPGMRNVYTGFIDFPFRGIILEGEKAVAEERGLHVQYSIQKKKQHHPTTYSREEVYANGWLPLSGKLVPTGDIGQVCWVRTVRKKNKIRREKVGCTSVMRAYGSSR